MTSAHTVPPADWPAFFDRLSVAALGKRAELEAASLELGDQILAEWVPLLGVTFDPRGDLLDVTLTGLDHPIRHPRQIRVQEGARGVEAVAIVSADDVTHVLRLKDPLMLPALGPAAI